MSHEARKRRRDTTGNFATRIFAGILYEDCGSRIIAQSPARRESSRRRRTESQAHLDLTNLNWTLSESAFDGKAVEMHGVSIEVIRRQPDGRWLYVIGNRHGGE